MKDILFGAYHISLAQKAMWLILGDTRVSWSLLSRTTPYKMLTNFSHN